MAEEISRVVFDLDATYDKLIQKLDNAKAKINAVNAPVPGAEKQVDSLIRKEKDLEQQRKKANDPAPVKTYNKELKTTENQLKNVTNRTGELTNMVKSFAASLGLIAGVQSLVSISKDIINTRAEFEKFEAVLKNVLGSGNLAKNALMFIEEFAAKTPYSIKEITEAYVKLANQGFAPTAKQLRQLGDLAASQAKPFEQLAEAILDAQVMEFIRLREFGILARDNGKNIIFTFKGVRTEVEKNAESIQQYILSLGDLKGVMGSTEVISKTLTGQISNLGDAWDTSANKIGKSTSGVIAVALKAITLITKNLGDAYLFLFDVVGRGITIGEKFVFSLQAQTDQLILNQAANKKLGDTERKRVIQYRDTLLFQLETQKFNKEEHENILMLIEAAGRWIAQDDEKAKKASANAKIIKKSGKGTILDTDYVEELRRKYADLIIEISKLNIDPTKSEREISLLESQAEQVKALTDAERNYADVLKKIEKEREDLSKKTDVPKGEQSKRFSDLNKQRIEAELFYQNTLTQTNIKYGILRSNSEIKFNEKELRDKFSHNQKLREIDLKKAELDGIDQQKLFELKIQAIKANFDEQIKLEEKFGNDKSKLLELSLEKEYEILRLRDEANKSLYDTRQNEKEKEFQHQQNIMQIQEKSQLQILRANRDYLEKKSVDTLIETGKLNIDLINQMKENQAAINKEIVRLAFEITTNVVSSTTRVLGAIFEINISQFDRMIDAQTQRINDAKEIASKGNAALLDEEKKRMDSLMKERERNINRLKALAQIELIINSALAISQAIVQSRGNPIIMALNITATLAALAAGFIKAREQAVSTGGSFESGGFTGHGNPHQVSTKLGKRPYTYHKEEFMFNAEKTRKYRNEFEAIHNNKMDLHEVVQKASIFDKLEKGRINMISPAIIAGYQNKNIDRKLERIEKAILGQKTEFNIDSNGIHAIAKNIQFKQDRIRKEAI